MGLDTLHGDLSKLKLVRIGKPLPRPIFERFARKILNAFRNVVCDLEVLQYEPPAVERIEASLLTTALDQSIGGHILGVTDLDLVDSAEGDFFHFMFGGKDHRNHVAVVSTSRLRGRDPDVAQDRILKVGLHEVGHNFGLLHHYSFTRAADGAYCPMSKGSYNRYGERSYVRSVIDGRGFCFCAECREFLQRFHPAA